MPAFCERSEDLPEDRNPRKKYISCRAISTRYSIKKKNKTHIFLVERFISSTCSTKSPSENPWITPSWTSRVWRPTRFTRGEAYHSRGTQPSLRRKWRSWYICSSAITHLVLAYSLPCLSFAPSSRLIFLPALICATPRLFLALSHRRARGHNLGTVSSYWTSDRCIYVRGSRLAGFTLSA